jgi:uncharacterized protein (DUF2141 family)
MKTAKIFLFVLYSFSFQIFTSAQCNLEIEISGIKNNDGRIILQLLDKEQKVKTQLMSEITDKKCVISIKNLIPGKYAVRYYHDENLNSVMDTNFVGKPTEGYGFSNNVTGKFGSPPFEKWLFKIRNDTTILLNPTY